MNNYIAKSNPIQTIQEHTNDLLKNYKLLRELYPMLSVKWELLRYACIYHDLGKMNMKFQIKIEKREINPKEIPHGILSLPFIDYCFLEDEGYSEEEIKILFQAVAYHHNREMEFTKDELEQEIKLLKKEFDDFIYEPIKNMRFLDDFIEPQFFVLNERTYGDNEYFLDYIKIKGLLNRLDYAASGSIKVETKNDFLKKGLENFYNKNLKPKNYEWNDLQKFMRDNSDENVVVVAQTGMGKTEAGLLWIGDNKGFFTLPLKSAINEIYKRVTEDIAGEENKGKVGLLHSDTYSKYLENKSENDDIEEYYNKTRQLSLPLTICTLDQIFDFVFRYKDFEPKLATLAYSKVIIDEVQMYSSDLLAYLILGLYYIDKIGGKFAILTATLPEIVTDLMKKEKIEFKPSEKPFISEKIRHSMKVVETQIDSRLIASMYENNKILVICNTVKKAQEIYQELIQNDELNIDKSNIKMLHSKFIKKDRKQKEKEIMEIGKLTSDKSEIWVATQVVEASLDIDFDLLFTELSDINGLFQRFGRCYRKREFDKDGYNCYVFNGGEDECSGVKYVVDRDIFNFSKEELKKYDGKISEQQKLDIIGKVYTTEKLENTDYYKKVVDNIRYVRSISEYEMDKSEVKKRFRNINNITIIPKPVYEENKVKIEELIKEINRKYEESDKNFKEERIKKIYELKDFSVDVRESEVRGYELKNVIKIGKYEEIPILDCNYSYEEGIVIEKKKAGDRNMEFDSRYIG